jgi:hypothetical protein
MYSSEEADIPHMTSDERKWLIEYYRDDVNKLSALLNKDLGYWLI